MTRKQAREEAFILVFEKVFNDCAVEEILEIAAEARDLEPDDYIKTVFLGVYENVSEAVKYLRDCGGIQPNWSEDIEKDFNARK